MSNDPVAKAQARADAAYKLAQDGATNAENCRLALQRAREYVDTQHKAQDTQLKNMMKLIKDLSKGLQDHHKVISRMDKQIQQLSKKK